MFRGFLGTGIPGRAVSNKLVGVNLINLRDFGRGSYRQLDDYAFGSGGMLFAAPQLKDALDYASVDGARPYVVYPSPQGALITQEIIESLARQEHVVIVCGRYEGIDERFIERCVNLEVSAGDCVLTGGEIPAMLIVDAMSRLVPGVVGRSEAVIEDSFYRGMLDNPNYTRPASWEGLEVPEVLLSGNAGEISRWRRRTAAARTLARRPDLIARASIREYIPGGVNIALILKDTNENLEGLFALCRAYELGRPYLIAEGHELRTDIKARYPEAKILGSIANLKSRLDDVLTVRVFGGARTNSLHSLEIKRICLEHDGGILFLFAEDEAGLDGLEGLPGYLYESDVDVPLMVKIGIALDKYLGKR